MKDADLIQIIADGISNDTIENIFQHIAPDCVYVSSGEQRAAEKEEVCSFFMQRQEARKQHHIACFAFPAIVEESEEENIPVGTHCAALAYHDKYNCAGFITIQTNEQELITRFDINTTPTVKFKISAPGKYNITNVPEDGVDAISYRAFAFGILDEHVVLSRHVQRYDEFEDYIDCEMPFIVYKVVEDFEQRLSNIAGYLYATAMSSAVKRERGIQLIQFDETESDNYLPPTVDSRYQQWISDGFETGRIIFRGFIEYLQQRQPTDEIANEQLRQSLQELMVFASIQANKDMDLERI